MKTNRASRLLLLHLLPLLHQVGVGHHLHLVRHVLDRLLVVTLKHSLFLLIVMSIVTLSFYAPFFFIHWLYVKTLQSGLLEFEWEQEFDKTSNS